jgi:hypothetical protein
MSSMKQNCHAPLLSLALVLLLFQPLDKSDRTPKTFPLTPNRNNSHKLADSGVQARPGLVTLAAIPAFDPVDLNSANAAETDQIQLDFERFITEVSDGQPEEVRGVHVPGVLELPVIQQPSSDGVFVSPDLDVATQFRSAASHGVTGLLAHNYLSGRLFYNFNPGSEYTLSRHTGIRTYRVDRLSAIRSLTSSLRSDLLS